MLKFFIHNILFDLVIENCFNSKQNNKSIINTNTVCQNAEFDSKIYNKRDINLILLLEILL